MGVQDRDYMGRDRDSFDLRPRSAGTAPKLWLYGLVVTALALWLAPLHWFPPNWVPLVQKLRAPREFLTREALPRGRGDGAHPQPQSFSAPQQAPAPTSPPTRRCLVNGVIVDVLNAECPPTAPALNVAAPTRPIEQPPLAQPSDPLVKPGTIYRCKNYSGGMFWSQAHCAKHNALVDRIAPVPVGLPFQQQVDIASGEARESRPS